MCPLSGCPVRAKKEKSEEETELGYADRHQWHRDADRIALVVRSVRRQSEQRPGTRGEPSAMTY